MLRDSRYMYRTSDLGDLRGFKLKKLLRKIGGTAAGVLSFGILKPKAFGVKSESGKRYFKIGKKVGIGASVATGIFFGGPATLGFLKAKGPLMFGKLTTFFKSKGLTDAAAKVMANRVIQGQESIPPELQPSLEAEAQRYEQEIGLGYRSAGILGEIPWGMVITGVVGVAVLMFLIRESPKERSPQVIVMRKNLYHYRRGK